MTEHHLSHIDVAPAVRTPWRHRIRRTAVVVAAALVGCSFVAVGNPVTADTSTVSAASLLSKLKVAPEARAGYSASKFGTLVDINSDGCNSTFPALQAQSTSITESSATPCTLTGKWRSLLDGKTYTRSTSLRVRPLVMVDEAWESGASSWSGDQRRAFINDVEYRGSLLVGTSSAFSSRSNKGPQNWLPSNAADRCAYATAWIGVKTRWSLRVDAAEKSSLQKVLKSCKTADIQRPAAPSIERLLTGPTPVAARPSTPVPQPSPTTSTAPAEAAQTLVGYSGNSVSGLDNEILGTWMARDSWSGMASGHWLYANAAFKAFVKAHPDRPVDIGVPLIPHDSGIALNKLLDEAISGKRDKEYRSMGAALAKMGSSTVYARIYWEMNMSPQPANSLDRAKFRAAWDHAVPLIRQGFAAAAPEKSLQVVFCPISDGADYTQFYPSSANVDVIAMDVYASKWGTTSPTAEVLTATVQMYLDSIAAFARSQEKPVALGEWGNWQTGDQGSATSRGRADFAPYVDQVFDWARKNNAKYIVYFNLPDGGVGQTLADTPATLRALKLRASK